MATGAIDTEVVITHGESFDITNIQRSIRFTGDLDETQHARLLEIADRGSIQRRSRGWPIAAKAFICAIDIICGEAPEKVILWHFSPLALMPSQKISPQHAPPRTWSRYVR